MSVRAVAVLEGDNGKEVFIGRDDGSLSRFSAKVLAAGGEPSLKIDNVHNGAIVAISAASADEVTTAGIDGTVRTNITSIEPPEGKRETRLVECGAPLRTMLVTPDQIFAGGSNGVIFNVNVENTISTLEGHSDAITSLTLTEAGYLLSASYDYTVRVWDLAQGKAIFSFNGHTSQVKSVKATGPYVYTASADDTLRLWAISEPAEGEAAAEPPAPAEGEEGAEGAEEGAAPTEAAPKPAEAIPGVHASAVIELPETPNCSTLSGANLYLGFADGRIVTINTRDLGRTVQNYQADVSATYKKCKKHLDQNAYIATKNLRIRSKKSIKAKKTELKDQAVNAAKEVARAAAEKRKAEREAAGARDDDEDDEEGAGEIEPEIAEEEGEEGEITLTEDQEKDLADFIEQAKTALEMDIKSVQDKKEGKIDALGPINRQKFLCERPKFDKVTFTRTYGVTSADRAQAQPVTDIFVEGTTAFVTSGETVKAVECRPGVLSL